MRVQGGSRIYGKKRRDKKRKSRQKDPHNFLGSTRVAQVTGFRTSKTDITVGDKKTKKLYEEDIKKTKRQSKKNIKKTIPQLVGGGRKLKL